MIVAEVAHEALLRAWPRLADWLREERDFLVCKGEAERAQRRWLAMGEVDKALLTGLDLARAEEWLPTRSEDLSPEVTAFVQRSIAADRAAKERRLRFQRRVSIRRTGGSAAAGHLRRPCLVPMGRGRRAKSEAVRERDNATAAETRATPSLRRRRRRNRCSWPTLRASSARAGDAGTGAPARARGAAR